MRPFVRCVDLKRPNKMNKCHPFHSHTHTHTHTHIHILGDLIRIPGCHWSPRLIMSHTSEARHPSGEAEAGAEKWGDGEFNPANYFFFFFFFFFLLLVCPDVWIETTLSLLHIVHKNATLGRLICGMNRSEVFMDAIRKRAISQNRPQAVC